MAYLFDLSQTNILKDIRKLKLLLSEILPLPKQQNDKVKRLETIDEIEELFPGLPTDDKVFHSIFGALSTLAHG